MDDRVGDFYRLPNYIPRNTYSYEPQPTPRPHTGFTKNRFGRAHIGINPPEPLADIGALATLPGDVIHLILLEHLDLMSLERMRRVCRQMNTIILGMKQYLILSRHASQLLKDMLYSFAGAYFPLAKVWHAITTQECEDHPIEPPMDHTGPRGSYLGGITDDSDSTGEDDAILGSQDSNEDGGQEQEQAWTQGMTWPTQTKPKCRPFGGFVFLLTCKRVCLHCLQYNMRYVPLPQNKADKLVGPTSGSVERYWVRDPTEIGGYKLVRDDARIEPGPAAQYLPFIRLKRYPRDENSTQSKKSNLFVDCPAACALGVLKHGSVEAMAEFFFYDDTEFQHLNMDRESLHTPTWLPRAITSTEASIKSSNAQSALAQVYKTNPSWAARLAETITDRKSVV